MPIYEYECLKCGEVFESIQKKDDPPPKKHACGSRRLRKVMSQSSFVLKGSGWYITDYGRNGKKATGDSGDSHGAGGSGAESSGDTGTAGKPKAAKKSESSATAAA